MFKGYTEPLLWISSEIPRSSVINSLYQLSDETGKEKIENALKLIYKHPRNEFNNQGFIELLVSIALLNITSLFPDIYKLSLRKDFKDVKSEYIPYFLDIHTYILKVLFGLTHERGELKALTYIAKRDILNKSYMLECFNFLMNSPKNNKFCLQFIPELLAQSTSNERDYEGVIYDYLKVFGEKEQINRINEIIKILNNQYPILLVNKFQQILQKNNIFIYENDTQDGKFYVSINNNIHAVFQKLIKTVKIWYLAQDTNKIVHEFNIVCQKKGKNELLSFLKK
ncbi:MAG: hypothetical protein HXX18_12015 [Bacteroidetes bacterium]|nr:hypothetical protein [Bacteroidota bacterium]